MKLDSIITLFFSCGVALALMPIIVKEIKYAQYVREMKKFRSQYENLLDDRLYRQNTHSGKDGKLYSFVCLRCGKTLEFTPGTGEGNGYMTKRCNGGIHA